MILNFTIISCNNHSIGIKRSLKQAKENVNEIEKVLSYYNSNDSLKHQASIFLIENMPYHSYIKPNIYYNAVFDSVQKIKEKDLRKKKFFQMLDSISKRKKFQREKNIFDIESINSDFIINNIEFAFKAWEKVPKDKRASFSEFCNFILPYRSSNEPIEKNTRSKLFKEYSWANNLLNNGASLRFVVDSVKSKLNFTPTPKFGSYYRSSLSISQIEKSRVGLCDDGVNYLVSVFRSIGIISSKESVSHWGTNPSKGHSWVFIKYGDEEYSTGPEGNAKENLTKRYKGACIPKVYRRTYKYQNNFSFSPFGIDVTHNYVPTLDIKIENELEASTLEGLPVLCVFDINKEWSPISFGNIDEKGSFSYTNIGYNKVLYMAGFMREGHMEPINYPFVVDSLNQKHFFKPSDSIITSAELTRKIGLTTYIKRFKLSWSKQMNRGFFEVANNAKFINAKTIHKISKFSGTLPKRIKLKLKEKYEFVRFNSNKEYLPNLAELTFYDKKEKVLHVKIIEDTNHALKDGSEIFDKNTLTFFGGRDVKLHLKFDEPKLISAIEFQPRNDDNHINIGEQYELFYWDKEWISLGSKIAKDTILYYDVQENALLWLRNHTKGKEEHVFTIDENKKQKWISFDN